MVVTAERMVVAVRPTGLENLCPGCGSVRAPRSFYCQTHIADLWRQVWDLRPENAARR